MHEFTFHGGDGTRLVGWRNEGTGPRVLLCNGLAAPAESWPGLLAPDCGFEVVSWHQRGFYGSDRPGRLEQARLQVQSTDALALMDHLGWDDAVVLGWSFGVNMACELAIDQPDRVSGMVAVAGVPGGTFRALLGKNPLPPEIRKLLGITGTTLGESQAWGINLVAAALPDSPLPGPALLARALLRAGVISDHARPADATAMIAPYLGHDFGWYFRVARLLAEHEEPDIGRIGIPVAVLVGSGDIVTDPRAVERFGRRLPDASVRILPGTHFLPVEHPIAINAALHAIAGRTSLAA